MEIIKGDLIQLARIGQFDVIGHGCNCFCVQGAGIAKQMVQNFRTDTFPMENVQHRGDVNKLGTIDYQDFEVSTVSVYKKPLPQVTTSDMRFDLTVVNMYTQYNYGSNHIGGSKKPIDYEALTLCLRKINHTFMGARVGLPLVGGGLAGGEPNKIKEIMSRELKDCDFTLVEYVKN